MLYTILLQKAYIKAPSTALSTFLTNSFKYAKEVIAEIARESCADVRMCASAEEGARLAVQLAEEQDVLVATGSMYLLNGAKIGFTAE